MSSKNNHFKLQISNDKIKTFNWINGELTPSSLNIGYLRKNNHSSQAEIFTCLSIQPIDVFHQNIKVKKATLSINAILSNSSNLEHYKIGLYGLDIDEGITSNSCKNLIDYECTSAVYGEHKLQFDITRLIDKSNLGEISETNIVLKLINDYEEVSFNITNPQLEIIYETSYITNDMYYTNTHSLGRFGQGAIDLICGKLEFFSQDFSWEGRRMPVTISHKYNSAMSDYKYTFNEHVDIVDVDFNSMNIGLGWRLNLMQCMKYSTEGDKICWIHTDENGNKKYFKYSDKNTKCDGSNLEYKLFEDENGNNIYYDDYRRKMINGDTEYYFDDKLRLEKICDKYSSMNIEYACDRISKVIDGIGREFNFQYDENGFLTSIKAPNNSQIFYGYVGELLTDIIYPDGTKAKINYTINNKPKSVTLSDLDNTFLYKVEYIFNGDKVESIVEFTSKDSEIVKGTSSLYNYDPMSNKTTVKNIIPNYEEDVGDTVVTTIYSFDEEGELIGQYAYGEDEIKYNISSGTSINPLVSMSNIENNVDNLLINHEFNGLKAWTLGEGDCEDCSFAIFTNEQFSKFGKRVLALQGHGDNRGTYLYQDSILLPAGEYTFSAYVKPTEHFTADENEGIYLEVESSSGDYISESERVKDNNGEYIRISANFTINIPQSVRLKLCVKGIGTVYFNAPQLENNSNANQYNLLVNSNFEHDLNCWDLNGDAQISEVEKFNMLHSLRLDSDLSSKSTAKQTVCVKSLKGIRETFALSGWGKAFALPERERNNSQIPEFNIAAVIKYTDGTTEKHIADFCPYSDAWQPTDITFSKNKYCAVECLTIECNYGYNLGSAFFDDIRLFRTNIETGLSEADFASEEVEDSYYINDKKSTFKEACDQYGNIITSTHFLENEFGTMYSSYDYIGEVAPEKAGNDLINYTDSRGLKTHYIIDENTSCNSIVVDRCGNRKVYEYDDAIRKKKIISQKSDGTEISHIRYEYDNFNNINKIIRSDGMQYICMHNEYFNIKSIGIEGYDVPLVSYTYKNGNGRLKEISYANGYNIKIKYNGSGQAISETIIQDETVVNEYKYSYDNFGNLIRALDSANSLEYNYTYDGGKLIRYALFERYASPKKPLSSIEYIYDKNGLLSKRIVNDGSNIIVYKTEYPENSDPITKIEINDKTIECYYNTDSFSRKTFDEIQTGTGFIYRQFGYYAGHITDEHKENKKLRSSPITNLVSQIILSDGRTISYEYDGEERINKVTDSFEGTTEYTYDEKGQLLTETHNGIKINSINYYEFGNISNKNGILYTYDKLWKDKLISVGDDIITYDMQGNPINYLGHSLVWSKGRQLVLFDDNYYTYNMNGVRTDKVVNGIHHRYVTDGSKILKETWDNNTMIPIYDYSNNVCGINFNGKMYYFLKNLQNDVISILGEEGETLARYKYDAWGKSSVVFDNTDCGISTINPYRYRGYYFDEETGLYYLYSRYYDPNIGRFINSDLPEYVSSYEGNLFAYCNNYPVGTTDYYGFCGKITIPELSSEKTIVNATILTTQEFKRESKRIKANLEKIDISSTIIEIENDSPSSLKTKWNDITNSDIVIINCHGNYDEVNGLVGNDIGNLRFQFVKLLILLSCDSGRYEAKTYNPGASFATRVTGQVICSDGDVIATSVWRSEFKSYMGRKWYNEGPGDKRYSHLGWLIYDYRTIYRFNKKTLSINTMITKCYEFFNI